LKTLGFDAAAEKIRAVPQDIFAEIVSTNAKFANFAVILIDFKVFHCFFSSCFCDFYVLLFIVM